MPDPYYWPILDMDETDPTDKPLAILNTCYIEIQQLTLFLQFEVAENEWSTNVFFLVIYVEDSLYIQPKITVLVECDPEDAIVSLWDSHISADCMRSLPTLSLKSRRIETEFWIEDKISQNY